MKKYAYLAIPMLLLGLACDSGDSALEVGDATDLAETDTDSDTTEESTEEDTESSEESTEESTDEDGESTDTGGDCYEAPEPCLNFVACAGAIAPDQAELIAAEFGEQGSCWCDTTEEAALACYEICLNELDKAVEANPTEPLCHGQYCELEELNTDEFYGPVEGGACPTINGAPQYALQNPFGLPGSVCVPACGGLSNLCPDHTQTTAEGTCYLSQGDQNLCVPRCWVDPFHLGETGTQCQCGARCQPHGAPDGEGNQRGICTFE